MLRNLPEKWDMAADLVAIGSGIGGLSAAITARGMTHGWLAARHACGDASDLLDRAEA